MFKLAQMTFVFCLLIEASIAASADDRKGTSLTPHKEPVTHLALSENGSVMITGGESDKTVRMWIVPELKGGMAFKHGHRLVSVAMFRDHRYLVSVIQDDSRDLPFPHSEINIWNVEKPERPVKALKTGHRSGVSCMALSVDGEILATGSFGDGIKLWDMVKMEEKATLKHAGIINALAFDRRSNTLASASNDGTIKVWDADKGNELSTLKSEGIPPNPFRRVVFSTNGLYLVTTTWESLPHKGDGEIRIWKKADKPGEFTEHLVLESNLRHVLGLSFSVRGGKNHEPILATATYQGTVRFWNVEDGKELGKLTFKEGLSAMAFNPGGKHLAVALMDKQFTVKLVDVGELLQPKPDK